MPAPVNSEELIELISKSGIVEESKLRAYIKRLVERATLPADPSKLAGLLVRDAILTYFQAEQILQGKYKRFTIGKYKVLEKLGAGGMGQVFLCEHKLMRRRVAVKVLPTAKAEDPSSLERFYREARAVAAVDHPNIVRAYDIDQDENLHFLVMEYVDGTNLQDLVKKVGPLDPIRACHYIYGASVGLQHAHEIGLVHRDIKPGNILVDRAGVVKILDMGLARFFNDDEDILTKKYDENVLGTADYLAPEQALDSHTVDIRADIYSLGATFYFLLTGSPPFPEGSVAQKLIWHQNRHPRHIRSLRADVPDEIIAITERMMMKDPAKRFQVPADVMATLSRWVSTPIPPPSDREMPTISPAAGGTRAPATMAGSARGNSQGEAPTVIAPGPAPVITPPPHAPLVDLSTPAPAIWETLDADTQTLSRGDTDPPAPDRPSRSTRPLRLPPEPVRRRIWIYLSAGVATVVLVVIGYLGFSDGTKPNSDGAAPANNSRRITVSKAGGESSVATLRDALTKAAPGDTIIITEPRITESKLVLDRHKHKDLTIESALPDGKAAVIEASGTFGVMLDATTVDGLRLKNIEFDGKGVVETGVVLSGSASGTVLSEVCIRGVKTAGIKLANAAGEPGRPILIERCRLVLSDAAQTGVWIYAANADSRFVAVQNIRVEGKGAGVGVRLEGGTSDVEISGGRFFNLDSALWFAPPPSNKVVKARVLTNTIFQVGTGLTFYSPPTVPPPTPPEPPPGKFDLSIERNYFANTRAIATSATGGLPGVSAIDNGHGPDTGQGTFPINVYTFTNPVLPSPNPSSDGTFLRFPGGPPEIPEKRVKVGAP